MPASSTHSTAAEDGAAILNDPRRPDGLVTFLFSDIEGSTRLWEEQPQAMSAALARHDALMQEEMEASGGFVFKTLGDAFHAAFARPESALAAALAAQAALHGEVWRLAHGKQIRVRMALHTGQAEQRGGDYFGAALSRTARLLAAGHGGQTLLSEAAAALLSGSLPPDVRLRSLGRHRFKDLAQAQEVSELLAPDLPSVFPALRSLEFFPNNLPAQLTSFIGREAEMASARTQLAGSRLLTVTGMGGSGKTRLALQIAADSLELYPDGVWLVEVAALSDPALLMPQVAGTLGVREESEKKLRQTLIDTLRPQSLLLVLDNCEHLVEEAARVADALLKACPTLSILATSREALGISGEAVLPLPPLSLPALGTAATPDALAECEAVRFFVERATAALPVFRLSAGNAAAVASVCARLDGIPLALELAAARVKVLTPEQIDGRLDDRFRLLSGGSRTAMPRQQTLRALVDWSYDLLAPAEQTLLCRLSVFSGGWSLGAAEMVCAGGDVEDWEVLDLLSHLAAKSLVVVEAPEAGQVRYRLLQNIQSYAQGRLAQTPGEAEALAEKHRDFFLALAEEAEPNYVGANQVLWLNVLERDLDNLRAALSWSQSQSGDSLPRLAGALSRFWYGRSFLSEGAGWLEAALETKPEGAILGKVLNGLGMLSWCCGDYEKSRACHERDLVVERELQNSHGIARALGNLCVLADLQQRYDQAEAYGQESLALYQSLGEKTPVARMLSNLGAGAVRRKEYAKAEGLYREALAAYRETGDAEGAADTLHNMGELFLRQGRQEEAVPYFRESLLAQRTLGNTQHIASTLIHIAEAEAENHARVCLLWAAADHLLQAGGISALAETSGYRATLDKSRAILSAEQFQVLWSQGQRMGKEEIINFVLANFSGFSELQY